MIERFKKLVPDFGENFEETTWDDGTKDGLPAIKFDARISIGLTKRELEEIEKNRRHLVNLIKVRILGNLCDELERCGIEIS